VTCAPDADAGYEALKAGVFDVCALDHYMPGREGLDVSVVETFGAGLAWR